MKHLLKSILPVLLLAIILFAAASPVQAAGLTSTPREGKVVFGGNYTLNSGQTLNGDLAVLGGNAEVEDGATVQGSVFLAGGNLTVDGTVNGDVVILGGNLSLGETAVVTRGVNSVGGSINRAPGARIEGEVITSDRPFSFNLPRSIGNPFLFDVRPMLDVWGYFAQALILAALAMIVVMLAPKATDRTANAGLSQPVTMGGVGILTAILAPFVVLLMIITLIGIPVAVLAIMALVVAVTFGWIALGLELGQRLAKAFNTTWSLPLAAGLGTLVLALVANGVGQIPCVGWLAPFVVSMIGLGAVILTRFGSRGYPLFQAAAPVSVYPPAAPYQPAVVVPPSTGAVDVYPAPETPATPAEPPADPS